jgi:hypothetical protein
MNTKHTPGPWKIFSWPTNNEDDGKTWCYGMSIRKGQNTIAEHETNARLMSAAPDLLAALYDIANHPLNSGAALAMQKIARIALAKEAK